MLFAPEYIALYVAFISLLSFRRLRANVQATQLVLFLLAILFGLRGDCLPDYSNYEIFFNQWSIDGYLIGDNIFADVEPGYGLANVLFRSINSSFMLFIILTLLFSLLIKYNSIRLGYKACATVAMAFYIAKYFSFYELVTIRQGIAAGIGILCVALYAKNRSISFLALGAAITFHQTAILFSFTYLYKRLSFLITPVFVIFISFLLAYTNIVEIFVIELNSLNILPSKLYYYYFISQDVSEGSSVLEPQSILKSFVQLFIYLFLYVLYKNKCVKDKFIDINLFLFGLMVILRLGFVGFPIIAGRASAILGIAECVLSAYVYNFINPAFRCVLVLYYLFTLTGTLVLGSIYKDFWFGI